jgi:MYXO-CTERM domain-containing protein
MRLTPLGVAALVAVATFACGAPPGSGGAEAVSSSSAAASTAFANDQTAYDFFLGKGLTNVQAAGIVGNLDQESGVDPGAVQSGGPGRGIAQWSVGGRWDTDASDNVLWYATKEGEASSALTLQLEFIWYELQTFSGYGLAALQASTNVTDATVAFETDFEGCGDCDNSARIAYAESVLAAYGSAADAGSAKSDGAVEPPPKDAGGSGAPPSGPADDEDGGAAGGSFAGAPATGSSASSGGCSVASGPARGVGGFGWLALGFVVSGRRRGRPRALAKRVRRQSRGGMVPRAAAP